MTPADDPVAALAALLLPARARSLLSRRLAGCDTVLAEAPRAERLAALAASVAREPLPDADPDGTRTRVRRTGRETTRVPGSVAGEASAWRVLDPDGVLPFPLRPAPPGLLHVDDQLLALARRAARCAEAGLASVLGGEVALRGRLLPGLPEPAAVALVPVELTALADRASLAVDRAFAARVAERVAEVPARARRGTALDPAEQAILELAVLGALDAIAGETGIEAALAPRLGSRGGPSTAGACVELSVTVAGITGRALLFLPGAALQALPRTDAPPDAGPSPGIPASLRAGKATVSRSELSALGPGDVLLLDEGSSGDARLLLPGGATAGGRLEDGALAVERVESPGGPGAPDDLPVSLEVELASVAVPLRALARLAPGAVLPLDVDRRGRVTLRLGGARLAEGELVEVEGLVGVRILSLPEAP